MHATDEHQLCTSVIKWHHECSLLRHLQDVLIWIAKENGSSARLAPCVGNVLPVQLLSNHVHAFDTLHNRPGVKPVRLLAAYLQVWQHRCERLTDESIYRKSPLQFPDNKYLLKHPLAIFFGVLSYTGSCIGVSEAFLRFACKEQSQSICQ